MFLHFSKDMKIDLAQVANEFNDNFEFRDFLSGDEV